MWYDGLKEKRGLDKENKGENGNKWIVRKIYFIF